MQERDTSRTSAEGFRQVNYKVCSLILQESNRVKRHSKYKIIKMQSHNKILIRQQAG